MGTAPQAWLASSDEERVLRAAGFADARGVEQDAVVEAHEAERDEASFGREGGDDVVGVEKTVARFHNFQHDAFALFHRLPGGELQREFEDGGDDFVAGLPVEAVGDAGHAGACAGGEGDVLRLRVD